MSFINDHQKAYSLNLNHKKIIETLLIIGLFIGNSHSVRNNKQSEGGLSFLWLLVGHLLWVEVAVILSCLSNIVKILWVILCLVQHFP